MSGWAGSDTQVLVNSLAADAELASQGRLCDAALGPLAQLAHLVLSERLFAAAVGAAPLGQGDALALPLLAELPLELGERTHDRQQQVGHCGALAGEGELFFDELDLDAFVGQLTDDTAEVVEVASKTIHGMHEHDVTLSDETEHSRQLRTLGVFARGLIGERLVDNDSVQLAGGVLVQGAHPGIGHALPADCAPPPPHVSGWSLRSP